ncbi:Peptidyl-prolyl cis-trans isomerase D [Halomonadaceae bacterium LMG 33818]|uniref:SurA N-terminal domain-containing protein n=1 Tax=Cernens ardua TaxID=3402176 RepID=UPI003EDCA3CA
MLQQIRDRSSGWVTKVIVGVVVVIFALFGLERLGDMFGSSSSDDAATVNGEGISTQSLNQQVLRMIQSGQIQPDQQQSARGQLLEQMIQQALLIQYAHKGHMTFSNDQIDQIILSLPDFHDNQGRFSSQIFVQKLSQVGYTPESFRAYLARQMTLHQLQDGLNLGTFVTPAEQDKLTALTNQTRTFRYATLTPSDLTSSIQVSDSELQSWYQQHKSDYVRPAQVKLDYIVLDKSKLASTIHISNDELQKEYQNRASSADKQVSDIILNINANQTLQDAQKQMSHIQDLLKQGHSFASLARQYSNDKASASNGGSLGNVTTGIFGEPFDSVVKSLQPGQDSKPFQFDGALHLVRVTGIALPSFDQLKGQMTQQLQMQKVDSAYTNLSQELNDKSFSASDLKSVADATKLPLQHSDWLSRNASGDIFGHSGVMSAAFSDQVLNQGYNSDVIDLGNNRQIVLRVDSHRPEQQLTFDQIKDQVKQTVLANKTRQALAALAGTDIANLQKGQNIPLQWHQVSNVQRDTHSVDSAIVEGAFGIARPQTGQSGYGRVTLSNGNEAVIELQSVGQTDDQGTSGQVANKLQTQMTETAAQGLIDELTAKAKIVRH